MKLELKHLAPYLPYGLNTEYSLSHVTNSRSKERRKKLLTIENVDFVLMYCEPILRPLSDLTKEIEHSGEKFMPIEKMGLNKMFAPNGKGLNYKVYDLVSRPLICEYCYVEKLLEWHFDIFGLIPEGLAIDINTLKY